MIVATDGYCVDDMIVFRGLERGGVIARGYQVSVPDLENADPEYLAVLGSYRVINGYSGYSPSYFPAVLNALADHRSEALAPFRALGDLYVVIRPDVEKPLVNWLETQRGLERLPDAGSWKIYRLPRDGSSAPPRLPLPLPNHGESPISIPQ